MRHILTTVFGSLLLVLASCSESKTPYSSQQEKSEIQNAVAELMNGLNHQQSEKVAALWGENAIFSNPLTGETVEGRDAIWQYYKKKFSEDHKTIVDMSVDDIELEDVNHATAKGFLRISFEDKPSLQSAFKASLVKEEGKWKFQEFTEIELESAPSLYEHLKDLNWLEGTWVDKDENIEIASVFTWDKYKNFLIQNFTAKVLGQDQLEGQQIIGWDSVRQKIHSWVFDSDGGFGEGDWVKKDGSWYANMIYTLADARKATATLIYTKIDDTSYTFSSVGRDIDGEVLPDINPVVVHRTK